MTKLKLSQCDITAIEKELSEGNDVRLQTTSYGYRLLSDRVTVLKKASHDGNPLPLERQRGNGIK